MSRTIRNTTKTVAPDVAAATVDAIVARARDMHASASADLARCQYGTKHFRASTVSAEAIAYLTAAEGVVAAIVGAGSPAIPKILAGADWRPFVHSGALKRASPTPTEAVSG